MIYNIDDESSEYLDEVFEVLADGDRRKLLYQLKDEGNATLDELAQDLEPSSNKTVEQLKTEITHGHAPKMADFGLVDYDERSSTLRYTEDIMDERDEILNEYLEQSFQHEIK